MYDTGQIVGAFGDLPLAGRLLPLNR